MPIVRVGENSGTAQRNTVNDRRSNAQDASGEAWGSGGTGIGRGNNGLQVLDYNEPPRVCRIDSTGANPYDGVQVYLDSDTGLWVDLDASVAPTLDGLLYELSGSTAVPEDTIVLAYPNPTGPGFVFSYIVGSGVNYTNTTDPTIPNVGVRAINEADNASGIKFEAGTSPDRNKTVLIEATDSQFGAVKVTEPGHFSVGDKPLIDPYIDVTVATDGTPTNDGTTYATLPEGTKWHITGVLAGYLTLDITSPVGAKAMLLVQLYDATASAYIGIPYILATNAIPGDATYFSSPISRVIVGGSGGTTLQLEFHVELNWGSGDAVVAAAQVSGSQSDFFGSVLCGHEIVKGVA